MDRRAFLKAGVLVGATPALTFAQVRADFARTLILVELKGANDGLNTVVPFADPHYYRLRPRIAIRREEVVQLSADTGLHPALAPLQPLWSAGELSIVRGVGYPQPNLSHFRSIEIWDTASRSDEYRSDGWLARAFAEHPVPAGFAADGVVVGSAELGPLAGVGARAVTLATTEQFQRQARLAQGGAPAARGPLAHIVKVEADIVEAARGLGSTSRVLRTEFPNHAFGNAVKTAMQVLASDRGVPMIRLSLGGFDTHQNQPGTHANLLKQLAEGLVALRSGLLELGRWESSLVMTYSEFGRRVAENGSNGTDHGTAAAQLVLGGRVKGGLLGPAPRLDDLDGGNLRFAIDFRSYYATALERWWGIGSANALGGRFAPLDLLRA